MTEREVVKDKKVLADPWLPQGEGGRTSFKYAAGNSFTISKCNVVTDSQYEGFNRMERVS